MLNREKILTSLVEKELFKLFKNYYLDLIDLNEENEFAPIDWYSPSNNFYFEAKCRSKHYPNLVIEKAKWEILKQKENSYYVCSTPKGIYMVPINEIEEPVWGENWMRKSTFYGSELRISKTSGFIKYEKSIQIDQLLIKDF